MQREQRSEPTWWHFHEMVVKVLSTPDQGLLALLPMAMPLMDDTLNHDDACSGRGVVFLA